VKEEGNEDFEEIEVQRIPEPEDDDGVNDPPDDEDDGHVEGVDRDGDEAGQAK
jgi:hypothetical protein